MAAAHYVEEQEDLPDPDPPEDNAYSLFNLSDRTSEPYIMDVSVCGQDLQMEIDTGASWSLVSAETYEKLLKSTPDLPLRECGIQLRTYMGESLPVMGRVMVHVKAGQQCLCLWLVARVLV